MTKDTADHTLGSRCLADVAYELYKANWIRECISKEEVLQTMYEYIAYTNECDENDLEFDSYEDWLSENGFHDQIYVCFDEFCKTEFEDAKYMKQLLPESGFEVWCIERGFDPSFGINIKEFTFTECYKDGSYIAWTFDGSGDIIKKLYPNRYPNAVTTLLRIEGCTFCVPSYCHVGIGVIEEDRHGNIINYDDDIDFDLSGAEIEELLSTVPDIIGAEDYTCTQGA